MKRRLGLFAWIVSALVLVGAILAGVAILNFAWWGPGYPGARAPERVRTAPRVSVYDRVIVVEPQRVVFRKSTWASARFSILLGAAVAIAAIVVWRRPHRLLLVVWIAAAAVTFPVVRSRASDVVVPRGSPRQILLRAAEDEYSVVDARTGRVLLRLPGEDEDDAREWRDVIAEKIASRP